METIYLSHNAYVVKDENGIRMYVGNQFIDFVTEEEYEFFKLVN